MFIFSDRMSEPSNFSWVEPGLLAGSAYPNSIDNLQYLADEGVKYLVSVTYTKPLHVKMVPGKNLIKFTIFTNITYILANGHLIEWL